MRDRFTLGYLSGVVAGGVAYVVNYLLVMLHFGALLFSDFASIMIFGYNKGGLAQHFFGFLGYLVFSGLLGVLYAYILPAISTKGHVFKGIVFGVTVWFGSYAITLLYKVPYISKISFYSALNNFASALVYGVMLDLVFIFLAKRMLEE